MSTIKYRIAIVSPVPFYYQVPLFRELANSGFFDLTVCYCSNETVHGADVEKMYRTKNKFTDGENLLKGYKHKFLKNYSLNPSFVNWPFGLVNPGVFGEIRKNKYDAVILEGWNNFTWLLAFFACLIYKIPVIFLTDANVFGDGLRTKKVKSIKKWFLGRFIFKKVSGFLITSSVNKKFYGNYGVPEEKMVDFHFSYGYEKFLEKAKELKPQRQETRKSFGIGENEFVFLFVGRLVEDKNIFTLLDAFQKVKIKNKKLFIVGDGPLRNSLEQYTKKLNIINVFFSGFQTRESIFKFYNIADALVLPSVDEPWGMVVNEAMCFGLPVIVSDKVGAGVDLVKNGYNGFVFKSDNAEELSSCIEKISNILPVGSEVISKWITELNPEMQILKIMELLKK